MKASHLILAAFFVTSSRAFQQTKSWRRRSNGAPIAINDYERSVLFASDLEIDISNEDDVLEKDSSNTINNNSNSNSSSSSISNSNIHDDISIILDNEPPLPNSSEKDLPKEMLEFPRHSLPPVNKLLRQTEALVNNLHQDSKMVDPATMQRSMSPMVNSHDSIFANTYVDMGNVDTVGFDYDYTLVHYTEELLTLLYSMALNRLVNDRHYPTEMLTSGSLVYDNYFSIRGLAVDKETGWICHLSYTHKVAVAWEGREKVSTSKIFEEYRGKRNLNPRERRARLKPLNDLFSMAECCLIADTIQFFKNEGIDFCPSNVVTDILGAIRDTHISGDFHRVVADNPEKYFDVTPHLKDVLESLKDSGKRLIFAR